jgi:TatD DNase family protein
MVPTTPEQGEPSPPPDDSRWFDSHCHLQDRYLPDAGLTGGDERPSLSSVLSSCYRAGVRRAVCVGTDAESSRHALGLVAGSRAGELGAEVPELWATIGLHPHDAASGVAPVAGLLEQAMVQPRSTSVVAVGECGLDYHYDHSPRHAQRAAFAAQVQLAHRFALAVVIHAREAWDDLFDILRAEGVPERGILHCFTGGPEEARRGLDAGLYLSFSGIVTFKNADDVRQAAALCPLDRLLVETDSPFLAPVPFRGRPNQPSLVPLVGETVAAVKGLSPVTVAETSWDAAVAAFGLSTDSSTGRT